MRVTVQPPTMMNGLRVARTKDQRGGLGPDLECDTYKAAALKAQRQKEFSEKARQQFKQVTKFESKVKLEDSGKVESAGQIAARQKAERAKQYAQNIPKPKVVIPRQIEDYVPADVDGDVVSQQREPSTLDKLLYTLDEHDELRRHVEEFY